MVGCNVLIPQLLWFRRVRTHVPAVFAISYFGERRDVVRAFHHHRYLAYRATSCPSNWFHYAPTRVEVATLLGSFGLFFTLFLLFCRFIPVIAVAEVEGSSEVRQASAGVRT